MKSFEEDMLTMIENVKFRKVNDAFQDVLKKDIQTLKKSDKMFIPADKTRNFYKVDQNTYAKLLRENITKNTRRQMRTLMKSSTQKPRR